MRRIFAGAMLAVAAPVAAFTIGAAPALAASGPLPPPSKAGCYTQSSGSQSWKRMNCDSSAYIAQHIPHPEVLSGIGDTITSKAGAPFVLGVTSVDPEFGGFDVDTRAGLGAYSVQDNVDFHGNNDGALDAVQFTDQTGGNGVHNACVWQIDVSTQTYNPTCLSLPIGGQVANEYVEGYVSDGDLVTVVVAPDAPPLAVAAPDTFGLGSDNRWTNNSGSVLGEGDGSEAVFAAPTQYLINDQVASCLNDDGFLDFPSSEFPCKAKPIQPLAFSGYSPGPMTFGAGTVETNNLIPVRGNPPAVLPNIGFPGPHTAQNTYVATTSGKCIVGTPPSCS